MVLREHYQKLIRLAQGNARLDLQILLVACFRFVEHKESQKAIEQEIVNAVRLELNQ